MVRRLIPLALSVTLMACSCTATDIFSAQFLDDFAPFGLTPVTDRDRTGVIIVVMENLTREWRHGETAAFSGTYGQTGAFIEPGVPSVPRELRATLTSHTRTILLPCTAQTVSVGATVSRTSLRTDSREVTRGDNETFTEIRWIPQCGLSDTSAPVVGTSDNVSCGDIIIFGLLDLLDENGALVVPDYVALAGGGGEDSSIMYSPGSVISGTLSWTDLTTGEQKTVDVGSTACADSVRSVVAELEERLTEQGADNVTNILSTSNFAETTDLSPMHSQFQYPVSYVILSLKADSRLVSLQQLQDQFTNMVGNLIPKKP